MYKRQRYNSDNGWDSLTTLDLSGMTNLKAIRDETRIIPNQSTPKLTTLTLPNSVTEIGDLAFNGCTNLKLTELPDGLTKIGSDAFKRCTGITLAELPGGVTEIGQSAFYDCTGITLTALPGGLTQIEGYTLSLIHI